MEHRELSTKEVAEILNLSAPYVTALVKNGKLKAHPRQSGGSVSYTHLTLPTNSRV